MKFRSSVSFVVIAALSACASSTVQPMSKDTFKIDTHAAPACGPNGARNVAFKTAAIEVIRRGRDKFVLVGDQSDESFWTGDHKQGMIVRVIPENSPDAANALSAREQLGPDWQKVLTKGAPTTCS